MASARPQHLTSRRIAAAIKSLNRLPAAVCLEQEPDSRTNLGVFYESGVYVTNGVNYSLAHPDADADSSPQPLRVIFSKPKSGSLPLYINAAAEAFDLLRDKKVEPEFLQPILAWNAEGEHFSEYTEHNDLKTFIHARLNTFSLDELKRFIAQILSGAGNLHFKNLVHRDIKPENILVYARDGKFFLKYSDLDSVIETNQLNQALKPNPTFSFTPGYIANEYHKVLNKNVLDLKKLDSFAIGSVIFYLLIHALKIDQREQIITIAQDSQGQNYYRDCSATGSSGSKLLKMIKGLCAENPTGRFDAALAMNSSFFGVNVAARNEYFIKIKNEAAYQLFIDNHEFFMPKKNDYFFLLNHQLKNIILQGREIDSQLEECDALLISEWSNFAEGLKIFSNAEKSAVDVLKNISEFTQEFTQLQNQLIFSLGNPGNLISSQLSMISSAIEWEIIRIHDIFQVILFRNVNNLLDESFKEIRNTINITMAAMPLFSEALKNEKNRAQALLEGVRKFLETNTSTKKIFELLYSILVLENESRFTRIFKAKIEIMIGTPIEDYCTQIGLMPPQPIERNQTNTQMRI